MCTSQNPPIKHTRFSGFSVRVGLYIYHHSPSSDRFDHPRKKPHAGSQSFCIFSSTSPRQPRIYFLSTNSPVLAVSQIWNCSICGLLSLASFTEHEVFEIHPHRCMYKQLHSFLLPKTVPLYFVSPIQQLTDIWVFPLFG